MCRVDPNELVQAEQRKAKWSGFEPNELVRARRKEQKGVEFNTNHLCWQARWFVCINQTKVMFSTIKLYWPNSFWSMIDVLFDVARMICVDKWKPRWCLVLLNCIDPIHLGWWSMFCLVYKANALMRYRLGGLNWKQVVFYNLLFRYSKGDKPICFLKMREKYKESS